MVRLLACLAILFALAGCGKPPVTRLVVVPEPPAGTIVDGVLLVETTEVIQEPGTKLAEDATSGMVIRLRRARGNVTQLLAGRYTGTERIEFTFEQRQFHMTSGTHLLFLDRAGDIVGKCQVEENGMVTVSSDDEAQLTVEAIAEQAMGYPPPR